MADPARKRLTVHEFYQLPADVLERSPELVDGEVEHRTYARDDRARIPPFPELEIDLASLFLPPARR